MDRITALAESLCARADEAGNWSISSEELAELLGMDRSAFWRAIYEIRDRISFSDAVDGWSQESVGDLVTVLERLVGNGAEEELSRVGLFIPLALGLELMGSFIQKVRRVAAAHEIAADELVSMLRYTGSFRRAIGIYLETHTDMDSLIDECARSFSILQGMPRVGGMTARRYLLSMFARHLLDKRMLLSGLEERLRIVAAQNGFFDPEDDLRRAGAEARAGVGSDSEADGARRGGSKYEWACKALGFSHGSITRESLRARYRQLMMRHHPDVDPTGLERSKDINSAYAWLVIEVPEG